MNFPELTIGLFGIGLEAYWEQFEGLKTRLENYLQIVENRLQSLHPRIINLGLVDTVDKAFAAGKEFRTSDVDVIFLYSATYALSATVLPVVRGAKAPVIVLNLAPTAAINYDMFNSIEDRGVMTGEWLACCGACPVPEIANVLQRSGVPFYQVNGVLDPEDPCWSEIGEWIAAAGVMKTMTLNRLGCLGHYYGGMLDVYSDLTRQLSTFGGHIEMITVDELSMLRKQVTVSETENRVELFHQTFDMEPDCQAADIRTSACTSVALDKLVEKYKLGALAYYYRPVGNPDIEETISSIILGNSLLTARHIPVAGEYEIKNVQAMKIMDSFGAGGSFTEYYAMDYPDDVVLMGHDGPGHIAIAQGKTRVKPLRVYHGKVGKGLSVEMSVKHGPVTLLSVVDKKDGQLALLMAEGQSVEGPTLAIGNTNSRYRFPIGIRNFVSAWNGHGPAHHCAVGVGHISGKIEKLGKLLHIETIKIC